jgi:hypothetical protein
MSGYNKIKEKLLQFVRKYYINELIKGSILFLSLGFSYLIFTLFLEHFLWLKPTARTLLFWIIVFFEAFLFFRFIVIPIFKLIGLRKGISLENAAINIGNHFPEVKDKLLNILQLKENDNQSDLLLASINQKAKDLELVPFVKAVDFIQNIKYLKYAILPLLIFSTVLFTGNKSVFTNSLDRVVNYRTAFTPPAPFSFVVKNKNLQVIQGKSLTVGIETIGEVSPLEAKIYFDTQQYFLQNNSEGSFSYIFSDVQQPIKFYVEANGIQSQEYTVQIIKTPTIRMISLQLQYPNYLNKKEETIQNSGSLVVPEGTNINWKVNANQTEEVAFCDGENTKLFTKTNAENFEFSMRIREPLKYKISSSNNYLQDYENLEFSVAVLKDEFPEISVQTNSDSISGGAVLFAGQVSDDYGLKKLHLVYCDVDTPQVTKKLVLPISKANIQTFFYQCPEGLVLNKGTDYEFFFEVYDNDAVNGNKKARSKVFNYRQKTNDEIEEELLQEQRSTINSLENSIGKLQRQQQDLDKIQQELQNKKKVSWNDKKKVGNFIKRQEQYRKMMQRQTDKLQDNLGEKKEQNKNLQNKKEELKRRIEELKKTDKQQKLLDEIARLAAKLNKQDLVKKAKELAQQNKQQERSLERTLELVKRFYIEQKTMQIANKLKDLSREQEAVETKKEGSLESQKEIKKAFELLKSQLIELAKDNEKLKEPMELPDVENEKESIDAALKKAEDNLKEKSNSAAKKNQKKSALKMIEMSSKMQEAMMKMEADSVKENIEDLRKILENLVLFSMKQEDVMNKFLDISTTHPDYGKDLKKQNNIRTYFEHIDDSLYVLSMRLPKISATIQDDLSTVHYNLKQSLENFSEDRFNLGISNQRYVMTATNNLADYLSTMLNSMKNATIKLGKGKDKGNGFSLPDIIKKQGELSDKMKDGMKKGVKKGGNSGLKKGKGGKMPGENGKPGDKGENRNKGTKGNLGNNGSEGKGENDDLDGELYEIYKQQSQLRQQLKEAIKESEKNNANGLGDAKNVLKSMEQLEDDILKLGFNQGTVQKMQQLNYELLKLDRATLKQGKDNKRKANLNLKDAKKNKIRAIEFNKRFFNQIEILNRQSLPLQQNYKLKVREYFSAPKKLE